LTINNTEGIHKEPSYQQGHLGYGANEPFEISWCLNLLLDGLFSNQHLFFPLKKDIPEDKVDQQNYYVLMPSSKVPDVTGYFDMIVYADGDFDANELQEWKHSSKVYHKASEILNRVLNVLDTQVDGEWTAEQSAGSKENTNWLTNPQFLLTTPGGHEKLPVCIHLAQAKAALDLIPFQVLFFSPSETKEKAKLISFSRFRSLLINSGSDFM